MVTAVKRLWSGQLPLNQVFWNYAVVYGLLVNLVTSLIFVVLLAHGAGTVLAMAAFLSPVPYNLFVAVAVWRSANRYEGPKKWADWARLGVVLWMALLTAL